MFLHAGTAIYLRNICIEPQLLTIIKNALAIIWLNVIPFLWLWQFAWMEHYLVITCTGDMDQEQIAGLLI